MAPSTSREHDRHPRASVVSLCVVSHVKRSFTRNDGVLRPCLVALDIVHIAGYVHLRRPTYREKCDGRFPPSLLFRRRPLRGRIRSTIRVLGPGVVRYVERGLTFVLVSLLILIVFGEENKYGAQSDGG